jgi:hypothetical protein
MKERREGMRGIERKKFLPVLAMAAIECFGGPAYAESEYMPHYNPDYLDPQKRKELFGEALELLEEAVDETSDAELRSAGMLGNPAKEREAIKTVLPLLWDQFGSSAAWEIPTESFEARARARYELLVDGAKFFYDRTQAQEVEPDYTQEEFDRDREIIRKRASDETGLPTETVQERGQTNCSVIFFPTDDDRYHEFSTPPRSSFDQEQAAIHVSFIPHVKVLLGKGYSSVPPRNIRPEIYALYQKDEQRMAGLRKFVRAHAMGMYVAHGLGHATGLGHPDGFVPTITAPVDVMLLAGGFYPSVLPIAMPKGTPSYDVYIDRGISQAFKVAFDDVKHGVENDSFKLTRWLRHQTLKGTLKDILIKAEQLSVKPKAKK